MELVDYLRVLRRRWWIVAVVTVAAVTVAGVGTILSVSARTDEGASIPAFPTAAATHVLGFDGPSPTQDSATFATFEVLAEADEIPARVAGRLDLPVGEVTDRTSFVSDKENAYFVIRATGPSLDEAIELADTYAGEIVVFTDERVDARLQGQAERIAGSIVAQQDKIRELEDRIGRLPGGSIDLRLAETEREAAMSAYARLQNDLVQINSEIAQNTLYTLEAGRAADAAEAATLGVGAPVSPFKRLGYATVLGLLVGGGLTLVVERMDTRLVRRREVEEVFGVPVVAEIPAIRRSLSLRRAGSSERIVGNAALSDAFARVRLALMHMPRWILPRSGNDRVVPSDHTTEPLPPARSGVVLVTSTVAGEGRTTAVAHLANAFAEAGVRVAAIDCDTVAPALGTFISRDRRPGSSRTRVDSWDLVPSEIPQVSVAPAPLGMSPRERLLAAHHAIKAAREHADVVIVDTGPLLMANDAAELIPDADAVILVTRAGRVTREDAENARDLLSILGALVTGVVLVGGTRAPARAGRGGAPGGWSTRTSGPPRSAEPVSDMASK